MKINRLTSRTSKQIAESARVHSYSLLGITLEIKGTKANESFLVNMSKNELEQFLGTIEKWTKKVKEHYHIK